MPYSAAIRSAYEYKTKDTLWWEALVVSHPAAGTYYLTKAPESFQATFLGATVTFQPIPFDVLLPDRDGEGQQDLRIAICNVGGEMLTALRKASKAGRNPIKVQWTLYLDGNKAMQYDPPLELTLTDVTLTVTQMTGVGTRYNVFDRAFPYVVYRPDTFPGLARR